MLHICEATLYWIFGQICQMSIYFGSRILGAAGRLEFWVVFGQFWPLEVSIGTKLYNKIVQFNRCLLYTSPSPRDGLLSRMPSSA